MSHSCTPILVGVVLSVLEILLLSKTAKFPFPTMDYSPWSSKNLIDQNRLKKFMQVGMDVKCMHINFGGRGLLGFGDIATFKIGQISLSDHGLLDLAQKIHFMLIGIIIVLFHISDFLKIPENEEVDSWKKVSTSHHTHTHIIIIVFSIYSIIKQNMS